MQRLYEQIARVARTSVTVFITGESGSGKELVARTVHDLSRRRNKPFLAVNCGAISPNLIESEIFGHEKGSFTGADRQHQGFFERASGGTLFLDEITEMPADLQVKLLRVLETGRFMRVGASHSQETDVRIIAATNRDPMQAVAEGRLREDLMYRLNVFPIDLPPLRERLSDVPLLAEHFLRQICEQEGQPKTLSTDALDQLSSYHWPGNVRELRNAVHRAYVMARESVIDAQWLPRASAAAGVHHAPAVQVLSPVQPAAPLAPNAPHTAPYTAAHTAQGGYTPAAGLAPARPVQAAAAPLSLHDSAPVTVAAADNGETLVLPLGISLADAERALILATLRHCRHQKERTAAVLGVSLKTLYNRLKQYTAADQAEHVWDEAEHGASQ
jgi:DNA-binding NtrC family response regulator